jgi:hypothetical protein
MQRPRPAAAAGTPDPAELTARFFRGLYQAYDLHQVDGIHVVVPKGTPCFAGRSLADLARRVSNHDARPAGGAPGDLAPAIRAGWPRRGAR